MLGLLKFVDRGNGSSIRLKIGESEEEVLSPWRVRFSYVIVSWFNIVAVSVSSSFLLPIVMLFPYFGYSLKLLLLVCSEFCYKPFLEKFGQLFVRSYGELLL